MRSAMRLICRTVFVGGTALSLTFGAAGARAQQNPTQNAPTSQAASADRPDRDQERARVDQFLDDHKDIARDLRDHPERVNDHKYLDHHKDLRAFLDSHPEIRDECAQNPGFFVHSDARLVVEEDARRGDMRDYRGATPAQLQDFNRFADTHPEIAEQVRRNPSLLTDQRFVDDHPALRDYLQNHPEVRDDIDQNPNAFMREDQNFDRRGDDITRGQLDDYNRFADAHPEIAEQLRKDPNLLRDQQYVGNHPALQDYLRDHPEIRDEMVQNPAAFERRDENFDRRQDVSREDLDNFNRWRDNHPEVAARLRDNPELVRDHDFLDQHPDFRDYLQQNPGVQKGLTDHPDAFLQQQAPPPAPATTGTAAKPPAAAPAPPPNTTQKP
jgi:GrpB-like predicted nucleotidyltransferase (UPF0157 family)